MESAIISDKAYIRKKWLKSFCIYNSFYFGLGILSIMFIYLDLEKVENLQLNKFFIKLIFVSTITYICAYKFETTPWLLLLLIQIPISLICDLIKIMAHHQYENLVFTFGMIWPMSIYFWIHCARLRRCYLAKNAIEEE